MFDERKWTVTTLGGVENASDPAGRVTVELEPGSTMVTLTVDDGKGSNVHVFLPWSKATSVAMAIGACAVDL